MYNPSHFVEQNADVLAEFIEQHPLAILTTCGADGLEANQIPVVLHREVSPKGVLRCHLARANTQWTCIASGAPVLAIFPGAEHYITPNWYPSTIEHGKVVPTWNYVTVQVRGNGRQMNDTELLAHLKQLTQEHEDRLEQPWAVEHAPADYIEALMRTIVGLEIQITAIEGKWKASQNRVERDRVGVLAGLVQLNTPDSLAMSEIVRAANNDRRRG